ncbi:hypothetical protein PV325_013830, partial [Microctonus aethiopoides]
MEEISRADFLRLSEADKDEYLKKLLGEDDVESIDPSDSEDDDWFPSGVAPPDPRYVEASDNEDYADEEAENEGSANDDDCQEEEDDDEEREIDAEEESDNEVTASASNQSNNRSTSTSTTFVAKDKTVWNKTVQPKHQTPARNIVRQREGPHVSTKMLSISGTFKKFITLEMVDIIVRCTNKKAEAVYRDYNNKHPQNEPH